MWQSAAVAQSTITIARLFLPCAAIHAHDRKFFELLVEPQPGPKSARKAVGGGVAAAAVGPPAADMLAELRESLILKNVLDAVDANQPLSEQLHLLPSYLRRPLRNSAFVAAAPVPAVRAQRARTRVADGGDCAQPSHSNVAAPAPAPPAVVLSGAARRAARWAAAEAAAVAAVPASSSGSPTAASEPPLAKRPRADSDNAPPPATYTVLEADLGGNSSDEAAGGDCGGCADTMDSPSAAEAAAKAAAALLASTRMAPTC